MSATAPSPRSAVLGRRALQGLGLVLATFLAYAASLPGEFLWDDDSYVTENPVLRDPDGLAEVWTPLTTPQYYPAVFSVLWLEFRAWGLDPLGYHVVNLGLHALNALLVWAVFRRLRVRGAFWIGAAFALHPLHVETVSWVMELKNLLSGAFYLLAALAFLAFDEGRDPTAPRAARGRALALWAGSFVAFTLALLSKTVVCTLPAALVLALLYRGGGLPFRRWAPLLPHVAVGAALAVFTARLEAKFVGAQGAEFAFSLGERLLIATRALLFYPAKLLWPDPLLFNYPRWSPDASDPVQWWSVAAVAAVFTALGVLARRGRRGPLLAALYYAGTISPALGFVNFYPMLFSFVADHFCYLASLGVLACYVAALGRLRPPLLRAAARPAWVAVLALLTAQHARTFSRAEDLYRDTLAHNPDSWLAHSALGTLVLHRADALQQRGDFAGATPLLSEARRHFEASIELHDTHYQDPFNLALTLERQGAPIFALEPALRAAELAPRIARTRSLAGTLLLRAGRVGEALEHLTAALDLEPTHPYHLETLGQVYEGTGQLARAREHYRRAYELGTELAERLRPGARLALLLATATDDDVRDPRAALELAEELAALTSRTVPQVEQARAEALWRLGRREEARALAAELLELARRTGRPELERDAAARLERFSP